jgi:hypothetical protein
MIVVMHVEPDGEFVALHHRESDVELLWLLLSRMVASNPWPVTWPSFIDVLVVRVVGARFDHVLPLVHWQVLGILPGSIGKVVLDLELGEGTAEVEDHDDTR